MIKKLFFEDILLFPKSRICTEDGKTTACSISVVFNDGLILLLLFLSSSDSSGSSGGDETNLLSGGCSSLDGWSLTNVLMVTTSVGMFNGVHGNTSNLGPAVPLDLKRNKISLIHKEISLRHLSERNILLKRLFQHLNIPEWNIIS